MSVLNKASAPGALADGPAGWRRGAWRICTGKPARVLGYHVDDAYAQVGHGRIAVIYTTVWYCYRSSEIADTSGQIEVAQLGDI
jgi:hypothetical protein